MRHVLYKIVSHSQLLLLLLTLAAWGMFFSGLIAEYGFQLYPCSMCLYQRYVHFGIGVLGFMLYKLRAPYVLIIMGLCWLASASVAGYHVGVESKLLPAPKSCAQSIRSDSLEDLKAKLLARPVVRCDVPAWTLGGISMAGWNALASMVLAFVSAIGFGLARRHHD